jgi:glycine/D-amino acid oxidase-like deaminating enzyme
MTPDGRPVLGPEGPEGLYLAAGWSGTGFKKAPAVGAELARWVVEGSPRREGLRAYGLDRFRTGDLVFGEHEPGVQTPH